MLTPDYDFVLQRRQSYVERCAKNYMDSCIKVYLKECGAYPQVDEEMTEEPSVCFFGEKDEDGYIQWNYVEQPAPIDFEKLQQERHVHVCDEVKQLYHSYLFLDLHLCCRKLQA